MKRTAWLPVILALGLLAESCDELPVPETGAPWLTEEVVIFDKPVAGGAITVKLEFASLQDVYAEELWGQMKAEGGPDFHGETQIRYAAPILGGHAAGDFVPYLQVMLEIENLETGATWEGELLPGVGLMDGWHYMADVDLDGSIGLSGSGYLTRVELRGAEKVVLQSDVLDAAAGTFLGAEPIVVEGLFTLEDLTEPSEGGEQEGQEDEPKPGSGYGY